jgi:hypothetical protein
MFRDDKVDKSILKSIKTLRKCWFPSPEYEEFDLYEVPTFLYKKSFPDHKEIREDLLKSIQQTPVSPSKFHTLKRHDWDVPPNVPRAYDHIFTPRLRKLCQPFFSKLGIQEYRYWFNQYEPGVDECFIHCHQHATISGIYYIELEKKQDATIFVSPNARRGYQVPVKEGDVLLWDPMVPHLAPKTRGAKTIISFNLI